MYYVHDLFVYMKNIEQAIPLFITFIVLRIVWIVAHESGAGLTEPAKLG